MKFKETAMKYIFAAAAAVSIIAVIVICVFLFANGIPAINEIGWKNFLEAEFGGLFRIYTAFFQ